MAGRVDQQLEDQARRVHSNPRWLRFDAGDATLRLTRLYQWYGGDFEQVAGSVLGYVGRYAPRIGAAVEGGRLPVIDWLEYDWALNRVPNALGDPQEIPPDE